MKSVRAVLFVMVSMLQLKVHAWDIDLSRRQVDFQRIENARMPASVSKVDPLAEEKESRGSFEVLEAIKRSITPEAPSEKIVIAQTEDGFVPNTIHLLKGKVYEISVVNLNSKEKNVSFLMDSFSQSHNTVFGVMKTFKISPNVEGVFSYQSPETGFSGKAVIIDSKKDIKSDVQQDRKLASTEEK